MALPKDFPVSRRVLQNTRVPWSNRHFFNGNWNMCLPYKSVMPPGPEVFNHLCPQWGLLYATGCFAITRAPLHYGATVAAIDIFHLPFIYEPPPSQEIDVLLMWQQGLVWRQNGFSSSLMAHFRRRVLVGWACKGVARFAFPPPKMGLVRTEPWWAVLISQYSSVGVLRHLKVCEQVRATHIVH